MDGYLAKLATVEQLGQRHAVYYYWGESLSSPLNHAFNDTLYEPRAFSGMSPAAELNVACALAENSTELTLEADEKEAYRLLCLSGGRFHAAGTACDHGPAGRQRREDGKRSASRTSQCLF